MFSLAALHLINVTTDPDLPYVNPHTYTLSRHINADARHKHAHNKAAERASGACVRVKEIEICVVTAGQLRGSDKQPTVRQDGGGQLH